MSDKTNKDGKRNKKVFPAPDKSLDALVRKNKAIMPNIKERGSIELILQVRDGDGNPTGSTKYVCSDKASEIETFLSRNTSRPKKAKKQRNSKTKLDEKLIADLRNFTKVEFKQGNNQAKPLNMLVYDTASTIIKSIKDCLPSRSRVILTQHGTAKLEIHGRTEKFLELEFVDSYVITYLVFDPENNFEEQKDIGTNELWKIRELIQFIQKK